jgi:hypothetical protein
MATLRVLVKIFVRWHEMKRRRVTWAPQLEA